MCFGLCLVHEDTSNPEVLNNIVFAVRRILAFILGLWTASYIKHEKKVAWLLLFGITIVAILIANLLEHITAAWLVAVPITALFCIILETNITLLNKLAKLIGTISLKSYLTKITLPCIFLWAIERFNYVRFNIGNYLMYTSSVIFGIIISIAVHNVCTRIYNGNMPSKKSI